MDAQIRYKVFIRATYREFGQDRLYNPAAVAQLKTYRLRLAAIIARLSQFNSTMIAKKYQGRIVYKKISAAERMIVKVVGGNTRARSVCHCMSVAGKHHTTPEKVRFVKLPKHFSTEVLQAQVARGIENEWNYPRQEGRQLLYSQ